MAPLALVSIVLQAALASPTDRAGELLLAARVDPERARKRIHELVALGPRMGGTRSGDAAAEALARALTEIGLDVRIVEDPEKDAWQPLSWKVAARNVATGETFELARAWPWRASPDAKGKAELALESSEGAAWITSTRARGEGGSAVVLVDGAVTIDGEYPTPLSLRNDAKQPCFGISRPEGKRLRDWLAAGAKVEIEYALDAEARRARPKTVLARLPGRGSKAEPWRADHFLFCAHGDSDSGGPGADDNASGVAAVLEIAAAWKAAIDAKEVPAPAREVRFAIWGSEIFSTNDHLRQRVPAEGELLGVVNYDQAGFGSSADQVNVEPDDLEGNAALVRTLVAVMADHAPAKPGAPGLFPARWATNKSLGGTDSYCFSGSPYFRERKLPSVTVFSSAWGQPASHPRTEGMPGESWGESTKVTVDYDAYYHSSGDTPENTTDKEPWNVAWCARVGLLGASRYLEALP